MNRINKIIEVYRDEIFKGLIKLIDNTDGKGIQILEWDDSIPVPTDDDLDALYLQSINKEMSHAIDSIAYSKIVNIVPEHTQRNMTARSAELLEKIVEGNTLTIEEQAERLIIKDIWNRVKAIRAHAQYLKSEVEAGNNPDIDEGWSE